MPHRISGCAACSENTLQPAFPLAVGEYGKRLEEGSVDLFPYCPTATLSPP